MLLSTTMQIPRFDAISKTAFFILDCIETKGTFSPVSIISSTFNKRRLPKLPAGCKNAKSSMVKFLFSNKAIARASPRTVIAVVLEVGARSYGHASSLTPKFKTILLCFPKTDSGLDVMEIIGTFNFLKTGSR